MIERGIATFGLDYGKCPGWLFEKMVRLGRQIVEVIIEEYGPDQFIKRIGDPVWFQSLGTVLAFDWNASGLTTILTASLKESLRGRENDLGIFICGGKGKTSLKTPDEIKMHSEKSGISEENSRSLIYNSKMAAKVDSSLVQDNFQIYHHSFFFSRNGFWTVVQQGMNVENKSARRYHWHSAEVKDLVCEPHSGISSQQLRMPTLDLTSKKSTKNREVSTEMVQGNYKGLIKDIQILRKHSSKLSQMAKMKYQGKAINLLNLENKEFKYHPVINEDFSKSKYLEKILARVCYESPESYEKLLSLSGVGPKTIRALSLIGEIIYGAKPSYQDPARYSFAHGGKDATPYPVDKPTYDSTIKFFDRIIRLTKTNYSEKNKMLEQLNNFKN